MSRVQVEGRWTATARLEFPPDTGLGAQWLELTLKRPWGFEASMTSDHSEHQARVLLGLALVALRRALDDVEGVS